MFKRKFLCIAGVAMALGVSSSFAVTTKGAAKSATTTKGQSKVSEQKVSEVNVGDIKKGSVDLQNNISNDVPHLGVNWDIYLGYAFANWSKFTSNGHGAWASIGGISPRSHTKGGFNMGGDLGYQIIRYFGMEFGYYYFRQVDGDNLSVQTPYYYIAGKVSYPFLANDDLSIFAKIGVAAREIEYGGGARQGVYNNKRYSIRPIYGLGLQYYFTHNWKASIQWLEIPQYTSGGVNTKNSSRQVPRTDQVLIGLGYLFAI
jgi:hypothetical protein